MRKQKLSRRTFLQSATAATFAAKLNPASAESTAKTEIPYPENGTLIPESPGNSPPPEPSPTAAP